MHFFGSGGGGCSFSFSLIFWKPNFYNNELSINYILEDNILKEKIKAQAIGFQRKEGGWGWGSVGGGDILPNEALYEQTLVLIYMY